MDKQLALILIYILCPIGIVAGGVIIVALIMEGSEALSSNIEKMKKR